MTETTIAQAADRLPLHERLARNADGIVEQIARDYGVTPLDVLRAMPGEHRVLAEGTEFEPIMREIAGWGAIMFIVHTNDIVLECEGPLPVGTVGRGYFNLHGDSPIGGHIRAENCQTIAFVSRPFMGRSSCSVQFYNDAGEAMFKIFVRRDENKELVSAQLALFNELRESYAKAQNKSA